MKPKRRSLPVCCQISFSDLECVDFCDSPELPHVSALCCWPANNTSCTERRGVTWSLTHLKLLILAAPVVGSHSTSSAWSSMEYFRYLILCWMSFLTETSSFIWVYLCLGLKFERLVVINIARPILLQRWSVNSYRKSSAEMQSKHKMSPLLCSSSVWCWLWWFQHRLRQTNRGGGIKGICG